MPSDSDLIRSFQRGHATAFETLYRRYARPAHLYARALAGREDVAEEAVQEAFLTVIRRIRDFRPDGSFRAYLFTGVRSRVIDALRRRTARRETVSPEALELFARHDGSTGRQHELRESVQAALIRLPASQREVVILKVFNEFTFREIAEVLGLSPNTVASRYRYGCAKLRRHLEGTVANEQIANG